MFRQLDFGAVQITLGIITIDIFTNGNFRVDLGFPQNRNFEVAFGLEAGPFIGRGGLYFAGIASTAIILIILAGVKPLEEAYRARNQSFQFDIRAERGKLTPDVLKSTLGIRRGQVKRFIAHARGKRNDEDNVQALISQISSEQAKGFGRKLEALTFVRAVKAQGYASKTAQS